MTLKRKASGSWVDIATTLKRKDSGSWASIAAIKRRLSGTWTVVWQAVSITDQSIYHLAAPLARAGYRLNTSGVAESRVGNTYTTLETWKNAGASSDYECRCTVNYGTLTAGTSGSWLALSSSQEWRVEQGTTGINTAEILIEIRFASGSTIDSAIITLEAEHL